MILTLRTLERFPFGRSASCISISLSCDFCAILHLPEVPGLDVMVETDAIGAAKLGDDLHDFLLLLWREQVLAMMVTVVRAIATTEERANTMTSLSLVSLWDIVIEMGKTPCFLHESLLSEKLALPVLPDHMDLEDEQDYICFIPDEFNS